MAEFKKAAQRSDIPAGSRKLLNLEGQKVALFNVAGTYYAISDTCAQMNPATLLAVFAHVSSSATAVEDAPAVTVSIPNQRKTEPSEKMLPSGLAVSTNPISSPAWMRVAMSAMSVVPLLIVMLAALTAMDAPATAIAGW